MSNVVCYRIAVLLLWTLAAVDIAVCRGLFWDGSAFLAIVLDTGTFHDFYPARAHVAWLTQAPVLVLARAGVRDLHILAIVFSFMLFAVPAALYHLALARVRDRGALLVVVIAVVAVVYLPTSFFIIGEYNIAYAAVTATFAIALTRNPSSPLDCLLMMAFGLLCIASYEAMIYLGPLAAAVIAWSGRKRVDLLTVLAVFAFLGAAIVSGKTTADYWDHAHFVSVRSAVFDFWQNLQFVVPLLALAAVALIALVYPAWLAGRGPVVIALAGGLVLAATPLFRVLFNPESMIFPPAHYVARTAAGGLLAVLLSGAWLHTAWPTARWAFLVALRRTIVVQRLATAMVVLLVAGLVPDLALTRLWVDHLAWFRGVVTGRTGIVAAETLAMEQWPRRLFAQNWTYPALSAVLHSGPRQAVVVAPNDYASERPFDPSCGTVPRLDGYRWP